MASDNGRKLVVTRRSDGLRDSVQVTEGRDVFRGQEAEHELLRRLWPSGLAAGDPRAALRSALERGVYLQQDVLTGFLTADDDQQRFKAISELIGTGRVTELQEALEGSRRAWSRATNQRVSEIADTERRRRSLENQLREFVDSDSTLNIDPDQWTSWWARAGQHGVDTVNIPRSDASDAQAAIDAAMAELRAIRNTSERRRLRLQELAATLRELPPPDPDFQSLHRAINQTTGDLAAAQTLLAEAEKKNAEIRRRQLERQSRQQELKVLAEVALRHLEEHCPVCQQPYDTEATRDRLRMLIQEAGHTPEPTDTLPSLIAITERVHVLKNNAAVALANLQDAERREQLRVDRQEQIRSNLAELGVTLPSEFQILAAIDFALDENLRELDSLSATMRGGEALALSLARVGQLARRAELEQELLHIDQELSIANSEIEGRLKTRETVSSLIDSLRAASSDLVAEELNRLEPLVQRVYSTADPNPEFRVVRLNSHMHRGHGRVLAEIEDPNNNLRRDSPSSYLSSSQMNVLAVSVFLALNLGLSTLPLDVAILDDPLQSLDDLNLIGLIDLLRRIRERRQLMISTHDIRFSSLLERKLRPVSESQRTILINLAGWSSEGPVSAQHDIRRDPNPIRIAAA